MVFCLNFLTESVILLEVFFCKKQYFWTQFRPKKDYPERACATVTFQGQNLAEALISRGLAVRIRHRQDDDNRSSQYDELVAAEQRAQKAEKGCYAKSLPAKIQIQELDIFGFSSFQITIIRKKMWILQSLWFIRMHSEAHFEYKPFLHGCFWIAPIE